MSDLEQFRAETAEWLSANAPESIRGVRVTELEGNWGGRRATFDPPDMKPWLEMCMDRGFTAPTWPTEYGGGGLDEAHAKVLSQEMARLRLPAPLTGFGLTMIGPTLLRYGTAMARSWGGWSPSAMSSGSFPWGIPRRSASRWAASSRAARPCGAFWASYPRWPAPTLRC